MATYHLYYLRQGMLTGSGEIEAADEEEAVSIASQRLDGHSIELWTADRRIRTLHATKQA